MSEEPQTPEKNSQLIDLESRPDADCDHGSNEALAWGSRSDVGLIREHNEDSYLCRPPLFAVSDGMGGHEAGEVASSIAIHTLTKKAPEGADALALAAALEEANRAVLDAPATGRGRSGMGCTLTACIIEHNKLACAHVGDSRIYLLHDNMVTRLTHDHSYVEELVDAGAITADEARSHPKRSIITRALGSDPDMYADHFTLDVSAGERLVLCSDGLSSMVSDAEIESICISCKTPQQCADELVSAALVAGGADNVTVVVVDILDDGAKVAKAKHTRKLTAIWASVIVCLLACVAIVGAVVYANSYFVAPAGEKIGIYQGFNDDFAGIELSQLVDTSDVSLADLDAKGQASVETGVYVESVEAGKEAINNFVTQANAQKQAHDELAEQGAEVDVDLGDDPGEHRDPSAQNDTSADADAAQNTTGGEDQ